MRVLVVDDDAADVSDIGRGTYFRAVLPADAVYAVTVDAALQALEGERWELILLDRDMGERPCGCCGSERSGEDVVEAITGLPPARRPRVCVVHSWNLYAGDRMHARLIDAGIASTRALFGTEAFERALAANGGLRAEPPYRVEVIE